MSEQALSIINEHSLAGVRAREKFFQENAQTLVEVARISAISLARGGKILFCGNGGSAADAQHLAAEFVNRFLMERPPLPALALTTDTSVLTAVSNDYSFNDVFAKQVKALGQAGDVLVGISTSGNSHNVNKALIQAKELDMITVGLGGKNGGEMVDYCDYALIVPDKDTPIIQEVHIAAGHLLCRLVDYYLFEAVSELEKYLV